MARSTIQSIGHDMIGVHIRRSDNTVACRHSPLSGFIKLMNAEINSNHEAMFFLATDSPEVEEHFNAIFPGRITAYSKRSLDRNTPVAIQDALVDLICLSSCSKLIGSYWSPFSYTAAVLGGIKHIVVHEDQ